MAGYSSNNKYSMLGAFRGIARMIAYEVPMGVCVISVAIMAHSLNLVEIVQSQTLWYAFAQPLGFIIFIIALITDLGRIPFDQSEAEQEIISGYNTEYSGIRFGLFFSQEYILALLGAILLTLMFLGGWNGPIIPLPILSIISPVIWLFMKTVIVLWRKHRGKDQIENPSKEKEFVDRDGNHFAVTPQGLFYCPKAGEAKKHPCPDCHFCQWCSDSRCSLCRKSPQSCIPKEGSSG